MQIRFTGTSVGVETVMNTFYMFYTVHCGIIANENQQNAQSDIYFSICSTYMFRSCLIIFRVRCYSVSNPYLPPHSAHTVHRTF
jgi:hypothetical protein